MPSFHASSSNLKHVEHDGETNGTLTVTFKTGRMYAYAEVPFEFYVLLRDAQNHPQASVGKRFNQLIRGVFEFEEMA